MRKKLLSTLLILAVALSLLPGPALAAGTGRTVKVTTGDQLIRAFKQAADDDTIVLAQNIQCSEEIWAGDSKTFTLDLNGHTLRLNDGLSLFVWDGANVTIQNGIITQTDTSKQCSAVQVGTGEDTATITLDNAKISGYVGIIVRTDSVLEVKSGSVTGESFGIATNGGESGQSIKLEGGAVAGGKQSCGVYLPSGTLEVSGGEISGGAGIVVRGGTLKVEGGVIRANGKGNVEVGDAGYSVPASGIAIDKNSDYANGNVDVSISGGAVSAMDSKNMAVCYTEGGLDYDRVGQGDNVSITGGKFLTDGRPDYNGLKRYITDEYAVDSSGYVVNKNLVADGKPRVVAVKASESESDTITAVELGRDKDGIVEVQINEDSVSPTVSDGGLLAYWVGVGIVAPEQYEKAAFTDDRSSAGFTDYGPALDEFHDGRKGFTIWINAGAFKNDGVTYTIKWAKNGGEERIEVYHITLVGTLHGTAIQSKVDAAPQAREHAEDYIVKKSEEGASYTTYTVTADNVRKYKNADGAEGYWVGVGFVPEAPEGISPASVNYKLADSLEELESKAYTLLSQLEPDVNGTQPGIAVYVDAADYVNHDRSLWIAINWPGSVELFEVRFEVTLRVEAVTVTFDANGGKLTGGGTAAPGADGKLSAWPTATRDGYAFVDWYTEPENGTRVDNSYIFARNTTLYAHWVKEEYTVTFDANGGALTGIITAKTADGRLAALPTPVRSGYAFDGWYTAAEGGDKVDADTVFKADTTVYAHWVKEEYTITFDANGGTLAESTTAVTTDGKLTALPTPVRGGYIFGGWYTAAGSGDKVDAGTVFRANTTVYAHWVKEEYTITFDANSGALAGSTTAKTTDGKLATLPTPARDGYTFDGWYTAAEGGDKVDANTVFNADATIYAHWTEEKAETKEFTITFDANGGTVSPGSAATTGGKLEQSSFPTPAREGCTFDGWYTAAEGGDKVDADTVFKADTKLYAHWTEEKAETKEFTITFDANGGAVSPDSATTADGKLATLPTPTRSGYTFSGWYTAASGGDKVGTDTVFKADATVYARWTATEPDGEWDTYSVRIDSGRHGTVSTSHVSAEPGTRVTITVDPDADYVVDEVEIERVNGLPLSVDQSGRRYTFTMPYSDVTVYVSFALREVYTTWFPPQSQTTTQTSAPALTFTPVIRRSTTAMWDVPDNSWAYPAAQWAYQNGYLDMAGDGSFRLDDPVPNLQMWRIMAHWMGEAAMDDDSVIHWARQNGAIGVGSASGIMTRQNMVEYLYQCCFLMGGDVSATGNLIQYRDCQLITSDSAKNAWLWSVNRGIISGTADGYLNPNKNISRGEFASILMRLCQNG